MGGGNVNKIGGFTGKSGEFFSENKNTDEHWHQGVFPERSIFLPDCLIFKYCDTMFASDLGRSKNLFNRRAVLQKEIVAFSTED